MGKLELNGTGKKRPGRHKTERKGTVTRKLGASPQEWDPADHNQVKAGRNCRNYTTVQPRYAEANEIKVLHGHQNKISGTGITNMNGRLSINKSS